jgi:hypothetical protein
MDAKTMTPALYFLFFAVGTATMVFFRLDAERSERRRKRLRSTYSRDSPIWIRNGFPLLPLWAPGLLLFSLAAILPRQLALLPIYPALILIEVAFVLSYRVPAPFIPGWLRDEIVRGVTPVARPDRLDWILFWLVLPVIILGDIGFPILVLGHSLG